MEAKAIAKYIRMSPRKIRLVADLIRGKSTEEAQVVLKYTTKLACQPLLKLLRSALANAKDKKMDTEKLYIKQATADGGPVLKRSTPRAFGRAAPIRKRTSHITIVLAEK